MRHGCLLWSVAIVALWTRSASADDPLPFAEALPDAFEQNEQDPAIGDAVEQGSFVLPSPIKLTSTRMPVLADIFPRYSPRNRTTAWGRGWEAPILSIRRYRIEGAPQFTATDQFTSAWGTLQASGASLFVRGFLQPIEGQLAGTTIVIRDQAGTEWTYDGKRYSSARGSERWELAGVKDVFGNRLALTYGADGNLEKAAWTRQGLLAHQVDVSYTTATTVAASDFIAGTDRASRRRVDKVVVSNTHRDRGTLVPVATYAVRFEAPKREWLVTSIVETRGGEARTTSYKYGTPWFATADRLGGKLVPSAGTLPTYPTIPRPGHAFASDALAAMDVSDDGGSDLMAKGGTWWIYDPKTREYIRSSYLDKPDPDCVDPDAPWPTLLRLRSGYEDSFLVRLVSKAKGTLELTQCSLPGKVVARARLTVPKPPAVAGCESITAGPIVRNHAWPYSMADLNADGVPDLSVGDACRLLVWYGRRDGEKIALASAADVVELPGLDPTIANVALDYNGDGLVDVIDYSRDQRVWLNKGNVRAGKPAFTAPTSLRHEQTEGSSVGTCHRFLLHIDTDRILDSMIACQLTEPVGGAPGAANFRFSFFRGELDRFRQIRYFEDTKWMAGWPSTLSVSEFAGPGLTFVELQPTPRASQQAGCPAGSAKGATRGDHGPEYWCSPLAYWMSLGGPDADVMTGVDNGRGDRTTFKYAWSAFPERFGRGPAVLASKLREMVGRDPVTSEYRYEDPWFEGTMHAFGGFAKITRTERHGSPQHGAKQSTSTFTFEVYAGIAMRQQTSLMGSDGSIRSRSWKYELKQRAGIPLVREISGATSLTLGTTTSERARTALTYATATDVCPRTRSWTMLVGPKTASESTFSYTRPAQASSLACWEASRIVVGTYAHAALGFRETQRQSYTAKGQLAKREAVSDGQALTLQEAAYSGDGNLTAMASGNVGATRFTAYQPLVGLNKKQAPTQLARTIVFPDGRRLELDYDPVTDQPTVLRAIRETKGARIERRITRTADAWGRLRSESIDNAAPWRTVEYRDAAPPQLAAEWSTNSATGERRMTVRDGTEQTMAELVATAAAGAQVHWRIESARLDSDSRNEIVRLVGGTVKLDAGAIPTAWQLMSSGATVVERWTRMPGSLDGERTVATSSSGELTWKTKASFDPLQQLVLTRTDGTRTESQSFDGANRWVTAVAADRSQRTAQYDARGRLRRLLFPGYGAFATYDGLGRMIGVTNGDLRIEYKYAPNSARVQCEKTTGTGALTLESCFTYNAIGQVLTRTSSTNGVVDDIARWTYEPGSARPVTIEGANYRTEITSDGVDAFGQNRETIRTTVFPLPEVLNSQLRHDTSRSVAFVETNEYRADGSTSRSTKALERDGKKLAGGELACTNAVGAFGETVRWVCGGLTLAKSSDAFKTVYSLSTGRTLTVTHGDGRKRWDRLVSTQGAGTWSTQRMIGPDGWTVGETLPGTMRGYERYPDGALREVQQLAKPNRLEWYAYDPRGLLASAQGQAVQRTGRDIALGSRSWRLDDLGRLAQIDGAAVTWSSRNQVLGATRANTTARYVHDASGQRLLRADAATWTFSFAGTQLQLPASGAGPARIRVPLVLDGHIFSVVTESGTRDVGYDATNTLVMADGMPSLGGAFGQRAAHQTDVPEYAGAYYDDLLGAYRFGVRDYIPDLAQFTSPDPLMLRAPSIANDRRSSNLYSYARANPHDFVDPSGMEECQTTSEGCQSGSGSIDDICADFGGCAPPIDVDGRTIDEICADFGGCAPPIESDYRPDGELCEDPGGCGPPPDRGRPPPARDPERDPYAAAAQKANPVASTVITRLVVPVLARQLPDLPYVILAGARGLIGAGVWAGAHAAVTLIESLYEAQVNSLAADMHQVFLNPPSPPGTRPGR